MTTIDPNMVEAIVRWWSSFLKHGPQDKLATERLPDYAQRTLGVVRQKPVEPEKIAKFEASFRAWLLDPKQHRRSYGMFDYPTSFDLVVEYEPYSAIMREVLKESGIQFARLPFKTRMEIRDGVVTITSGDRKGTRVYPPTEQASG